MIKEIQIVAFDNPNPPDYGGAVEVFYKIKAFSDLGIKIVLHLFVYGNRTDYHDLNSFCDSIYFYKRKLSPRFLLSKKPFIVVSREHSELLKNLRKNPAPVLFEGIHSCAFLHRSELKNHFKIVRMHNIEHEYYSGLAKSSENQFKKQFFKSESRKLKTYENQLNHADLILGITEKDTLHFKKYAKSLWIPPFGKPFSKVRKTEKYVLFHGNLSVSENYNAARYLTENVFGKLNSKVIVAGKSPHHSLIAAIEKTGRVELISNPDSKTMENLIEKAHCHVFYTDQNTGVKLKLIHALQTVGHVVLNSEMLFDLNYKNEVELADSPEEMIQTIAACMKTDSVKPRKELVALFDNSKNAQHILSQIENLEK